MIPKGFKTTSYKGWEITYNLGLYSGATATKGGVSSEHFWNPGALAHLKGWIDKQRKAIFKPVPDAAKYMTTMVTAPYVHSELSLLGGPSRASIIIKISLDPKAKWHNGILHNSRYTMFHLSVDGTLELFAKRYDMPKMRKARVTGLPGAVKKITEYISKAKKA